MKHTFIRFGTVGLFNTAFNLVMLNMFVFIFGLKAGWANILAISISICLSFVLNLLFVFRAGTDKLVNTFMIFVLVTLFCQYIVNQMVFLLMLSVLVSPVESLYGIANEIAGLRDLTEEFYLINIAKLVAVGFTVLATYYLYSKVVFKKSETSKKPATNTSEAPKD